MNILSPGTKIGQYEIASLPMMGGMGVVYFALDHGNDGRPVALKTFRPELLPDRAARDRFLREGTAWVELRNHPHIVCCYEVKYYDPTAFLVLELIAKEKNMPDASLRSWLIPGRPLPLEQALLFALQIARGMQYATEKIPGFVHRDLKPENILVGADKVFGTNINRLRVTDFGLVKTIANVGISTKKEEELRPDQIQFTRGVGTPLYMAPEQWKGEPVGVFTDVYAFGCIFYEMLSGQCAAIGKTITELQISHCDGRLRTFHKNLPQDVELLIAKCLVLNPANRYIAWNEVVSDLDHSYIKCSGEPSPQVNASVASIFEQKGQEGWSYNAMGMAYAHMGKAEMSVNYFEKSLLIARENKDHYGEGTALGNLGGAYLDLGEVKRAIGYFEQALTISRKTGSRDGECANLGNLGNAYSNLGEMRQAIRHYEQVLIISREIRDRPREGVTLSNLGIACKNLGEVQQAIGYFEQALAISREIGDRREESANLGNLGNAHADLREVPRAISYYEQQLTITREIGDRRGEGNALGNLGIVYKDLGEVQHAIDYYEQALVIAREIGDRRGEGKDLGNLGNAYSILGERQIAIECYEKRMVIDREIGNLMGIAINSFNLADEYRSLGNVAHALSLAQEAAKIFAQIGSPNFQAAQQLIAELQGGSSPAQANSVQAAFEAFQRADSLQAMQAVLRQYPFMTDNGFIQAIERTINEQAPPNIKPAFEQRLDWLKQLANK